MTCAFDIQLWNYCWFQSLHNWRPCFLLLHSSNFYIQVFDLDWVYCSIWRNIGLTSFFCLWISSWPSTIYWQNYYFPIKWSWYPRKKTIDATSMVVFLILSSLPLVNISVPLTAWLLESCTFVIKFGNRNISVFQFWIFFFF